MLAMQAQLKLTCQEIITLRRAAGAKEVEMASFRQEMFRLRQDHANEAEVHPLIRTILFCAYANKT